MMQMQRNHIKALSMSVVGLEEVAIFEERGVFGGFLQFSKSIRKLEQSLIYQSIAADQVYLQVTLLLCLASPIGRYKHVKVIR
jgi:hypothetical protein